jgi:hypothetical protein
MSPAPSAVRGETRKRGSTNKNNDTNQYIDSGVLQLEIRLGNAATFTFLRVSFCIKQLRNFGPNRCEKLRTEPDFGVRDCQGEKDEELNSQILDKTGPKSANSIQSEGYPTKKVCFTIGKLILHIFAA